MSFFQFFQPTDFRDSLSEIDALTLADRTSVQVLDLFGAPIQQIETYADFGGEIGATLTVQTFFALSGIEATVFTVSDADGDVFTYSMAGIFDISAGYALETGVDSLVGVTPDFISYGPGSTVIGTAQSDEMLGEGRFRGAARRDKIELEQADFFGTDGLGSAVLSAAFGGGGADILKAAVQMGVLNGQGGRDTLVMEFGTVTASGGARGDLFIVDNGFWDLLPGSTTEQGDAALAATITDFDGAEDFFILGTVDVTMTAGTAPERETLAQRFGAGDLSTLADFVEDGVLIGFASNLDGDAVITRNGTTSDGQFYDETTVFDGIALGDIDRSDVVLQSYAEETYEFF